MNEILLTLGHNSSAILVQDGEIVAGYETERLTGIKSDSHFPAEVLKLFPTPDHVYVSHWDPHGRLENMKSKHWWPGVFNPEIVTSTDMDFTHHDAHAWSALWFAGETFPREDTIILVVDGFGNGGEHFSVYNVTPDGKPKLYGRHFGYASSLGLMYQYATGFLGLRMNEDEYKLLGYEVHRYEINVDQDKLDQLRDQMCATVLIDLMTYKVAKWDDPLINISALVEVQKMWADRWTNVLKQLDITDHTSYEARVVIAHIVQAALEYSILTVVAGCNAKNVLLAGGVFYNVKLNKCIIDEVKGLVCINPLAGDQGAAIGLYYASHPEFKFKGNICWGHRRLYTYEDTVPNLYYYNSEEVMLEDAKRYISDFGFVNVVRGSMEFGPRALCNTSTLAIPDMQAVKDINEANGRNTIMPMAPAVTEARYRRTFKNTEKVHRSEEYMITALEYVGIEGVRFIGAAHRYEEDGREFYTGRPQVIQPTDKFMSKLLAAFGGILINTSFNAHGHPIPCNMEQIITNHMYQYERDDKFHTLVLVNS